VRPIVLALIALVFAACGDASSDITKAPNRQPAASGNAAPSVEPGLVTIAPDSPQLGQIRVAAVEVADAPENEVVAPARVGIDPNRLSKVLLPVPGRIEEVRAKLGDHVDRGQPLVAVESPDADAAVSVYQQSEAAGRQATAALQKAETDYQRLKELLEHGAVARKDLLAAENDRAQAQGTLEASRAAREQARRKLELLGLQPTVFRQHVLVRAPIGGKILEISVAPGEYRNDTNAPLMTIADLGRVWVSADVAEPAIGVIHVGDTVGITLVAFPGQDLTGRVARIADVVDPQTRTVKVHVELSNPDGRLRPEMFGSIRLGGPRRRVPVLPLGAVVQQYGRTVAFVERAPGRFERRDVVLGTRMGDRIVVSKGVEAGERVVVDGAILLKDR
jgi:cobalt-zinc-cadmium efflux system membrane fusion protein